MYISQMYFSAVYIISQMYFLTLIGLWSPDGLCDEGKSASAAAV